MSYVASRTLDGQTTFKRDLNMAHQSTDSAIITVQSYWPTGQLLANHGSTFKSPRLFHAVLANHRTKVSRENRFWDEFEFYTETINAIMTWLSALPFEFLWCDGNSPNSNDNSDNHCKNGKVNANRKKSPTFVDSFSGKPPVEVAQDAPNWVTAHNQLMHSIYYLGAEQALCNVFNSVICFTRVESLKFANYSYAAEAMFRSYRLSYPAFRSGKDNRKYITRNFIRNGIEIKNDKTNEDRDVRGDINHDVINARKIYGGEGELGGKFVSDNADKEIKPYATDDDDNDDDAKRSSSEHRIKLTFRGDDDDDDVVSASSDDGDDDHGWRWKIKPHSSFFPNLHECRQEILSAVDYVAGRMDPSLCEDGQRNETRIRDVEDVISHEMQMLEKLSNGDIERRVRQHQRQTSTIILMVVFLFSYLIAVYTIKTIFLLKKHLRDKTTHRKKKKKPASANTVSASTTAAAATTMTTPTSTTSTPLATSTSTSGTSLNFSTYNNNAIQASFVSPILSPNALTANSTMLHYRKCCNASDNMAVSSSAAAATLHNKQRKSCCAFVVDATTSNPTSGSFNNNQNMQHFQQQQHQQQHQQQQHQQQHHYLQTHHHQQQQLLQQQQHQQQHWQQQQLHTQQLQQRQLQQLPTHQHQHQPNTITIQKQCTGDVNNLSPNVGNTLQHNIQQISTMLPKKSTVSQSYKCNNYSGNVCNTITRNSISANLNNINNSNVDNDHSNIAHINNNNTVASISPVAANKLSTSLLHPPPNSINNNNFSNNNFSNSNNPANDHFSNANNPTPNNNINNNYNNNNVSPCADQHGMSPISIIVPHINASDPSCNSSNNIFQQ